MTDFRFNQKSLNEFLVMKIKSTYVYLFILTIAATLFLSFQNPSTEAHFSEIVKVALRDAGNKLLIANNDSTSLILPIEKIDSNKYRITFESQLSIIPDSLVAIVNTSLKAANLPKHYIVEVIRCKTNVVSYSFQIKGKKEQNIVPCIGRDLPTDCYTINILFTGNTLFFTANKNYLLTGVFILIFSLFGFLYVKRHTKNNPIDKNFPYTQIGHYKFYESQNKLIKDTLEIKLSTKECELIKLFSKHQNEVIKRDVLLKEIWEDHGVFVGRSLDTFISKLRKKFKDDASINIVNIHGVGYKLEVQ
jgi:hypothetical protein